MTAACGDASTDAAAESIREEEKADVIPAQQEGPERTTPLQMTEPLTSHLSPLAPATVNRTI